MEKKAEMIRRTRAIKWAKDKSKLYEDMMRTKPDPKFMDGFAFLLERFCEDFDISPEEIQQ